MFDVFRTMLIGNPKFFHMRGMVSLVEAVCS